MYTVCLLTTIKYKNYPSMVYPFKLIRSYVINVWRKMWAILVTAPIKKKIQDNHMTIAGQTIIFIVYEILLEHSRGRWYTYF